MKTNQLEEAYCQVKQAQAVLATWLELITSNNNNSNMIGAIITLLDGVPEIMLTANSELCDYVMQEYKEGKK